MMIRSIYNRIYSDFLLPDRMPEYKRVNQKALNAGYTFLTIGEVFQKGVLTQKLPEKVFVHRHDIDTDTQTARRFFTVEKELGIKSSFHFRLNHLDVRLMNEIREYGSEVGYHYEEIAQVAKERKLKSREDVLSHLDEIRSAFLENLLKIEKAAGFKIKTASSHGDFVNRKLGVPNHEMVNEELLKKAGLDYEAYDLRLDGIYSVTLSDKPYPQFYRDKTPDEAIDEKLNVIYLLTHPRHWHVSRWENLKDNILRLREGITYGK